MSTSDFNAKFEATVKRLAAELSALVAEKNAAYGNSFEVTAKMLRHYFPDGIRPDQYEDALGITRLSDKIMRIATDKDAFGENPWKDIAGYGLVQITLEAMRSEAETAPVVSQCTCGVDHGSGAYTCPVHPSIRTATPTPTYERLYGDFSRLEENAYYKKPNAT
jgi:hypothetical protein